MTIDKFKGPGYFILLADTREELVMERYQYDLESDMFWADVPYPVQTTEGHRWAMRVSLLATKGH